MVGDSEEVGSSTIGYGKMGTFTHGCLTENSALWLITPDSMEQELFGSVCEG